LKMFERLGVPTIAVAGVMVFQWFLGQMPHYQILFYGAFYCAVIAFVNVVTLFRDKPVKEAARGS